VLDVLEGQAIDAAVVDEETKGEKRNLHTVTVARSV
jgi:hypothetical protein